MIELAFFVSGVSIGVLGTMLWAASYASHVANKHRGKK